MAQGLQIWDASGVSVMDTNSFLGRIVGQVSTGYQSGSVSANLSTGTPFAFAVVQYDPAYQPNQGTPGGGMLNPLITATSSGVSWTFPPNSSGAQIFSDCIIFYGVY